MNEELYRLDHFIQVANANGTGTSCHSVKSFHRTSQRACMGSSSRTASIGRAELHNDDMLASFARHAQSFQKRRAIMHAFQIAGDDAHIGDTGKIGNVIGSCEARLIAAGDGGLRIDAAFFKRALDRHDYAARLAKHYDRTMGQLLCTIIRHGKEIDRRIEIAEAIRAGNSKTRCLDRSAQIIGQSTAIGFCRFFKA